MNCPYKHDIQTIYINCTKMCKSAGYDHYEYFTFIESSLIIEMFSYFRTISTQELRHIMSNLGEKMKVIKKRKIKLSLQA